MTGTELAEAGWVPDAAIRWGIRRMLARRLREARRLDPEAFVAELRQSPIALVPELANRQHYEVPPAFFERVLGRRLKYSCALWSDGATDLDTAEEHMLALTCERAGLVDGMRVLDLGCGWGSLSLWIAERHPRSRVLAVSNSTLQREHILERAARQGLGNLEVRTADVNDFDVKACERFDRVVSIEMFEHLRNYERLLGRIARWLAPDGRLFVHLFCHRELAYPYASEGDGDWMGRLFFTGGMMPSERLLSRFDRDLVVERHWRVDGTEYQRTCRAWLANLDARRASILPILAETYGRDDAQRWLQRWRLFFMGCGELFAYRGGREWGVAHDRLAPREPSA